MAKRPDNRASVVAAREGKRGQIVAALILGALGIIGTVVLWWLNSYPTNQPLSRPAAVHVAPGGKLIGAEISGNEVIGSGQLLKNEGDIEGVVIKDNRVK